MTRDEAQASGHGSTRIDTDGCASGLRHGGLTRQIIGAFYEVYNELGRGFLESVYQRALALALRQRGVRAELEAPLEVCFRGVVVGTFRADIVADDRIILEVKAGKAIDDAHRAQLLNYLRATGLEVGLLLNFGPRPEFVRLLLDAVPGRIRANP